MRRHHAHVRHACLALAAAALTTATPWSAHAAPAASLPADPNTKGFIGLCDRHNRNLADGAVEDAPFVWKAVASQSPPSSVLGPGQNAVLNIYQPRPGVDPSQWSGDSLTGASFYGQAAAPAVQATNKDIALSVVVAEFPPLVDGLYQLRMYFGKVGQALYSSTYPATWIRVDGSRWSVVSGGSVNCAAAAAQSLEVAAGVLSPKDAYGSPLPSAHGKPSASPSTATAGPARRSAAPGQRSVDGPAGHAADGSAAAASAAAGRRRSQPALLLWITSALAAAGLTAAALLRRRRRSGID